MRNLKHSTTALIVIPLFLRCQLHSLPVNSVNEGNHMEDQVSEKNKKVKACFGSAKGNIFMSDDFDEPLDFFGEYE